MTTPIRINRVLKVAGCATVADPCPFATDDEYGYLCNLRERPDWCPLLIASVTVEAQ